MPDQTDQPDTPAPAPDAPEDAVHVLAMVFDASTRTSALYVYDGADLARGPVAVVRLRHAVPHGLHGDWSDATYV